MVEGGKELQKIKDSSLSEPTMEQILTTTQINKERENKPATVQTLTTTQAEEETDTESLLTKLDPKLQITNEKEAMLKTGKRTKYGTAKNTIQNPNK